MACSKLEAMAIYLVKQACGNDILESVYRNETPGVLRPHCLKNRKEEKGSLQIQLVSQCVRYKIQTTYYLVQYYC